MKILIVWAALAMPMLSSADTVVPVEKVDSHVNIRQAPNGDAAIVGRLQQGSSLPLLGSTDGWNEVQLDDGESGFISADWTVIVVEEVQPQAESELAAKAEPEVEAEPIIESQPKLEAVPAAEAEPESEPESEPEPEPEAEPAAEPEAVVLVAPPVQGPPGPQGPQGPAGPPGTDGAGSMKGSPGYLVKFKDKTTGNASQVFDNGSQLGIGTNEPTQRLEVNGSMQIHDRNSSLAGLMITQSEGESTGYIMHNRASTLTIGAGSVDRMTIDRDGNVGIGVARPEHPLQMVSGAHVTAGGVWTNSSSRQKKENIQQLTLADAIEALVALEPVQYNYKKEADEQYIGFIAEDVPEIVATNDRKGLSTMDIVAVLTRVVQAQQQQIDELEARLEESK